VNVYPFIEAEKAGGHNVSRACALLEVSRAAYYTRRAGPSPRAQEDAELTERITAVHDASAGTYGAPRCTPSCAAEAGGTPASGSPD
jgi:putative transposase